MWTVAANKAGKWCRGALEAVERFMVRWHKDEADERVTHPLWVVPKGMGRGGGTVVRKQRLTKAGRGQQTG